MANAPRDALIATARNALQRGNGEVAEACARALLEARGTDAVAWTLLGTALRHRDPDAAESALRQAITLDRNAMDASFHLANLLRATGRAGEAIPLYRESLRRLPGHASLQNNLALALTIEGEHAEAEVLLRDVLAREPRHLQALLNLVHVLCGRGAYEPAIEAAQRYLRIQRDAPAELWIDVGIAQHALHDHEAAVTSFRRALERSPDDPVALLDLGSVLVDLARYAEAEPFLGRVVAAENPATPIAHARSLLAHTRQHLCGWQDLASLHDTVISAIREDARARINPFFLLSFADSATVQQVAARRWAAGLRTGGAAEAPALVRETGTPLRIGYISSDFRSHAVSFLAAEVWERHDLARTRTFAYALPPNDESSLRERVRSAFDVFHDLGAADARTIVERIRGDAIDVLIDLNGYTTHARPEVLAEHPARVQAQWLGYLGTMGAPWMDFVVTDRFVTPERMQPAFDERFLHLPHCYCPSDTRRPIAAEAPERAACGLPHDAIVLCCFNNPYKLLPDVFDVWMRLLSAEARAVLWLAPTSDIAAANLRLEAERRGVAPDRLVFAPRVAPDIHLARHVHADLYLDTLPYNAGTATNDALWMGVPVLTCAGETMAGRVAGSQLHTLGLDDLIATSLPEYEAKAMTLVASGDALRDTQARLALARATSPLFDMPRFTTDLESALASIANDA